MGMAVVRCLDYESKQKPQWEKEIDDSYISGSWRNPIPRCVYTHRRDDDTRESARWNVSSRRGGDKYFKKEKEKEKWIPKDMRELTQHLGWVARSLGRSVGRSAFSRSNSLTRAPSKVALVF